MYGIKSLTIIYCFILFQNVDSSFPIQNLAPGSKCKTPNGKDAICKLIHDCPILLNAVINNKTNEQQIEFLKKSQCGYKEDYLVCCGDEDDYIVRPTFSNINCGFQTGNKIYNGEETNIDEFPWLALLQYNYTDRTAFDCAGSVISTRYVLTAAHCLLNSLGTLTMVRLGEWNLNKTNDCIEMHNQIFCNDDPLDIEIESTIVHGQFDITDESRHYDIGLIRLMKDAKYSNSIQPICLPPAESDPDAGENHIVAGWGKTEIHNQSDIKLKARIQIYDYTNCSKKFSNYGIELQESQLCAGGESDKDVCTGDSGGPLMQVKSGKWFVQGIVSFGRACGRKGWPGVYTKVSYFIKWIQFNTEAKTYSWS